MAQRYSFNTDRNHIFNKKNYSKFRLFYKHDSKNTTLDFKKLTKKEKFIPEGGGQNQTQPYLF